MNSDMIPVWNRCNDYIYTIGELEEDESLVREIRVDGRTIYPEGSE